MKHLIKILRKFTFPILCVIVFLFIQAQLDLKLPEYTSNIVNVGIEQKGIENNAFIAIRESSLNKILLFSEDKDSILAYYDYLEKGSKNKKYQSILDKESIYVLKDISKEEKEKLSNLLTKPLSIKLFLEYGYSTNENPTMSLDDFYAYLSTLDKDSLDNIINPIMEQTKDISGTLLDQMTITEVINEYTAMDIDLGSIQTSYILKTGGTMVLFAFLIMLVAIGTSFLASRVAAKFAYLLREKLVNKVMTFSHHEFESFQTSSLITRSTNDVQHIQMLFGMLLRTLFYAPIIGIGAFLKVNGNAMSWIIGVALCCILCIVATLFTFAMPKFRRVQKLLDKLTLVARETLTGIPVIRAFSNEEYEKKRFDKANKDLTKLNLFVERTMSLMSPLMMLLMNITALLIIWIGADKIDTGLIQVGDLIAFITYTMQIIMSFLMFSLVSIMLPRAMVSVRRIGEVLDAKTSVTDPENPKVPEKDKCGIVEFKDVYFRYPDAEEDVIKNVSFKATPGTTTAFIGSTGSGKSTLINLIPRFFDVTGGKITIGNVNIKDMTQENLRDLIGYVPQKGMLFSGTILSNLSLGMDKVDDKVIDKSIEIAEAKEFISKKPLGLNEPISEGGTNVSGGQRQRLAIARALAKQPQILIFDDSFSALDYKTDATLRKKLKKEVKNATVFIVAQRISTVLHADQIIVLDKGSVVGIGTHEELLKNNQIYQEIAYSQLSKEELANE